MYLISPHKKQFKANLHCHSNYSDGKLTPEQLKASGKEELTAQQWLELGEKAKKAGFEAFVTIKGDVDGDGKITAADAREALNKAVGK